MVRALSVAAVLGLAALAQAQCPYADVNQLAARAEGGDGGSRSHLEEYEIDDEDVFLTSDVGGAMEDQESLKAGERGPTLLEDFIFRQKITHFDHERVGTLHRIPPCLPHSYRQVTDVKQVPERAVHARGAGSFGTFTSYGNYSNITSASFLSEAGKQTSTFVRFSTVAGSRGSADTARDVHGFATRLYDCFPQWRMSLDQTAQIHGLHIVPQLYG